MKNDIQHIKPNSQPDGQRMQLLHSLTSLGISGGTGGEKDIGHEMTQSARNGFEKRGNEDKILKRDDMKAKNQILKGLVLMLVLLVGTMGAKAQVGTLTQKGDQTVCLNSNEDYGVQPTAGSSYTWTIIAGTGGAGTITIGASPNNLISINWTSPGTCSLEVTELNATGCSDVINTINITVTPLNTILLSSVSGTDGQTACINNPITDITYSTTGASGADFTGLPTGVTGEWLNNVATISGTPTTATGSPFTYTVTLTGGCGTVIKTGIITVTPANTIALTSIAGTDGQTACINNPITDITYSTTGASGADFTGLPTGVTGEWLNNVATISGTPTTATGSPFTYTVTLTGGCGTVSITGTITVTPSSTIVLTSAASTTSQAVCINKPIVDITYVTTLANGALFTGLPTGVSGTWLNNVVTITGTPTTVTGSPFTFTVTLTGGCGTVTSTGTIIVTPLPATSPIFHN